MNKTLFILLFLSFFLIHSAAQTIYKCPSETIVINGNNYSEPGTYNVKYIGSIGQDSIVQINIVNYKDYHTHYLISLCVGEEYMGLIYIRDTILVDSFLTINGCDSTITTELDVQEFVDASITGDFHLCEGDTVQLTTGFYPSYLWSTSATSKAIKVSEPGEYSVIIANQSGCKYTLNTIVTMSDFDVEVRVTDITCKDKATGEILITKMECNNGVQDFSINIMSGAGEDGRLFSGLYAGEYHLLINDNEACIYEDTIVVIQPEESLEIEIVTDKESVQLEEEISCELMTNIPLDKITWYVDDEYTTDADDLSINITKPTIIEAQVKDENGCVKSISKYIIPLEPIGLLVPNIFSPNGDGKNDYFILKSDKYFEQLESISIHDRFGNSILNERLPDIHNFMWDGDYNGQKVNPGNYLVTIVYSYRGERRTFNNIITVI